MQCSSDRLASCTAAAGTSSGFDATTNRASVRVTPVAGSISAQYRFNMSRIRLQFPRVYALDERGQGCMRGCRHADLRAFFRHQAVRKIDLGPPAPRNVAPDRRLGRLKQRGHPGSQAVLHSFKGCRVFAVRATPVVRRYAEYGSELVALRAADGDRLRRKLDPEAMRGTALHVDNTVIEPGGAQYAVRDGIGSQLGPAFPPQILSDIGAVDRAQDSREFGGARCLFAMYFPHPEHRMFLPPRLLVAADISRLEAIDADGANNASDGLAPARDARYAFFVDAVLHGYDIALRRQILLDHQRCPFGIIGFGADDRDVDRFAHETLHFVYVHRFDAHDMLALGAAQVHPVPVDRVYMFGPGINQHDILSGARKMRSHVTADRACAYECNMLAHVPPIHKTS